MLEGFLGLPQGFVVFKGIEVRQHTHDSGKAVDLANVEELKRFHLKAKAGINQHQNLVGNARFSSVIWLEKTLLKMTGIAKHVTFWLTIYLRWKPGLEFNNTIEWKATFVETQQ